MPTHTTHSFGCRATGGRFAPAPIRFRPQCWRRPQRWRAVDVNWANEALSYLSWWSEDLVTTPRVESTRRGAGISRSRVSKSSLSLSLFEAWPTRWPTTAQRSLAAVAILKPVTTSRHPHFRPLQRCTATTPLPRIRVTLITECAPSVGYDCGREPDRPSAEIRSDKRKACRGVLISSDCKMLGRVQQTL